MQFKSRNLRALAECVIGDTPHFPYRSSKYISEFFEDCDLPFVHDGSTRWAWAAERLGELLAEPAPQPHSLPSRFVHLFRVLMDRSAGEEGDLDRSAALETLNAPLRKEGYEAYFDESSTLQFRHIATKRVSEASNPHRPFAPEEIKRRTQLAEYLDKCSEDELIEEVLLPMFRQLGYHRITSAGHADKALEYGKDVWMRFTLPTMHVIYFGIQAKKGKIDSSGVTKTGNANVAEIHNQTVMMLGHEIFDPELNRRVLVDHAFIVAGGEITKQARNWLGGKLDQSKRAQILFMDREDILNLFVVTNIPLPAGAARKLPQAPTDDIPF
ncbi:hypothetical protein [Pararhizobium sp.]|uniref:hypothetical protein n=1 Tax=Pararhizobium sp. TaxID=1977563 RepID=UPI003D0FB662